MPPEPKNTPPNDGGGDEQTPEYVTKDELRTIVSGIVGSALKKDLPKLLETGVGPLIAKALEPLQKKLETPEPEPGASGTGGDGKTKQPDPEVVALKKKLDALEQQATAAREEAAAERKKAREEKAYTTLCNELQGKVRPEALKDVADLLVYRGRLVVEEDGAIKFKHRTSLTKGAAEEDHEFPLADGVQHFIKSKEAALFLPPPNGGAGGDRRPAPGGKPSGARRDPARNDGPPRTTEEAEQRAAEDLERLGLDLSVL